MNSNRCKIFSTRLSIDLQEKASSRALSVPNIYLSGLIITNMYLHTHIYYCLVNAYLSHARDLEHENLNVKIDHIISTIFLIFCIKFIEIEIVQRNLYTCMNSIKICLMFYLKYMECNRALE